MKSKYYEWTKELIEQGVSYAEIGRIQGRDRSDVRKQCIKEGWTEQHQHNPIETMTKQLEEKGYELVDCLSGVDGIIHIKCKTCGGILERKGEVARHKWNILCEHCREIKHERQAQEKAEVKLKSELEKNARIVGKQQSFSFCQECGSVFYDRRRKYCSEKCAQRVLSRNAETRRRIITKAQLVDKDITLLSLYKRDNGTCYICGQKCDWNDYYYKGNTFIAGDNYPSIEHVIPLSKGGMHSWFNVKLSCRRCNYLKSDALP